MTFERAWQLQQAKEIVRQWRAPHTPVVMACDLGRPGQRVTIKTLDQLTATDADMRTVILVGSSQTRLLQRHDGSHWIYTPRRYTAHGNA